MSLAETKKEFDNLILKGGICKITVSIPLAQPQSL